GRWGGQSLEELTSASVSLTSQGMQLSAELAESVRQPSVSVPMPIRIHGDGQIVSLLETLSPWLPAELHDAEGNFRMSAQAEASSVTSRLTSATIELTQPRLAYGQRYFSQPSAKILFDGVYTWPTQELQARSFTIAADAFSLAAQGKVTPGAGGEQAGQEIEMKVKWRAKLERIQGSVRKRVAARPAQIQQVAYRPEAAFQSEDWLLMGDCEGEFDISTQDQSTEIQTTLSGTDFAIVQPPKASAASQTVGPMPNRAGNRSPQGTARIVWSEPNLKVDGRITYNKSTGGIAADAVQIAGDWFATTLTGSVIWNDTAGDVQLQGPARLKMSEVANRLSALAGLQIQAEGIQETPLEIRVLRRPDESIAMNVLGNIGWETAHVAGVNAGRASVPFRLTEDTFAVSPSPIQVEQGFINMAGQIHYRPGPIWMQVDGAVAESVQLTPQMTNRWLKYLAPLAAETTQISGTIGGAIEESVIVFDDPSRSRITGRLNIGGIQMAAGPIADQLLGGIDQLKSITQVLGSQPTRATGRTLITMPPQAVDFSLDRGIVNHERLFFEVDRARIITSGQVALDGRLNMIAQIPLEETWLGPNLKGMAGQPITLPIDGTLSRPSLDSSGVAQVAKQLGSQAIQSAAENIFQKQFNRVLDKTFGR
ncbi:MAG: hypothetical protein AB8B91_13820, partial [Rubripirellula sp.]